VLGWHGEGSLLVSIVSRLRVCAEIVGRAVLIDR